VNDHGTAALTTYRFDFTGRSDEYFRIWVVSLFLSVVTLGIYSAWGKVRKKRYLYSHTELDGTGFEFRAAPLAIPQGARHHAMRLLLQDSGLAVLMTALAGDAVGTTVLAAALPAVLLRTRYSRQFESEADDYAFAMLKRHGQSPQAFAHLMRRLRLELHVKEESGSLLQYLSTHPATEERIQRAEQQR
jgi:hypothetical protein